MSNKLNKIMSTEQNYRIGLTTQITGIRPETLRAWERRYEVVKPIRTDAGDRLYTQADIDRLLLIKKLVDNGDAISAVANLNIENLEKRISSCKTALSSVGKNDLNFILLGRTILDKKSLDSMRLNMIDVVQDPRNIKSNYHCKIDFIIAEIPILSADFIFTAKCSVLPPESKSIINGFVVTSKILLIFSNLFEISKDSLSGLPLLMESVNELDQNPS